MEYLTRNKKHAKMIIIIINAMKKKKYIIYFKRAKGW